MADEIEMIGTEGKRNKRALSGGIVTNLDVDLTDAERKHIEDEIELTEKFGEAIKNASRKSRGYTGTYLPGDPDRGTIRETKHHRNITPQDVRAMRDENEPVIPIAWDGANNLWVLDSDRAQAMKWGYICPVCLAWQKTIVSDKCDPIRGHGCDLKIGG